MFIIIQNLYIIKNGVLLYCNHFNGNREESLDVANLLAGFLEAIQCLYLACSNSSIESIECNKVKLHLYNNPINPNILFVFQTEVNYKKKKLNSVIYRVASTFLKKYSKCLANFLGNVSPFENFTESLISMNIK